MSDDDDARYNAQVRTLLRRSLTRAGNGVDVPVIATHTTLAYSLPLSEQDASYGVKITPHWNTSVWVTAKTKTGFTVNFGTAAPANATIDIATFRSA